MQFFKEKRQDSKREAEIAKINIEHQLAEIEKQLLIEEPSKIVGSKLIFQNIKGGAAFKLAMEELNAKVRYLDVSQQKFPESFVVFLREIQKNIFSESAEFSFDKLVDVRQQCDKMLSELLSAGSFPDSAVFRVQKASLEVVIKRIKEIAEQVREYLPPLESEVGIAQRL